MKSRIPFFQSILHLFFPHICSGCGSDLLTEKVLFCIYCRASMPLTCFEFFHSNPIEKIFWGRVEIDAASAHLYFTTGSAIQHSLHLLKYKGRKEIGIFYGILMGRALRESHRFYECEIIIPVPLHPNRQKKRGYNQAGMIAEGISKKMKIPVEQDVITRLKKTETQTRKSRVQRWKNMESTFEIQNAQKISGKHVLLVDDVVTTGASLEACAWVLLTVPGVRISIACLAYTVTA
jgi:ComF family protein